MTAAQALSKLLFPHMFSAYDCSAVRSIHLTKQVNYNEDLNLLSSICKTLVMIINLSYNA